MPSYVPFFMLLSQELVGCNLVRCFVDLNEAGCPCDSRDDPGLPHVRDIRQQATVCQSDHFASRVGLHPHHDDH
jgi:hypothetical protein